MADYSPNSSPAYLNALRDYQADILDSITENPCETQYRDEKYKSWVESTRHRVVITEEPTINSIGDEDINIFPHAEEL